MDFFNSLNKTLLSVNLRNPDRRRKYQVEQRTELLSWANLKAQTIDIDQSAPHCVLFLHEHGALVMVWIEPSHQRF